MASSIIATITDTGRAKFAEMLQVGRAFTVTDFATGEGGHDPGDVTIALTPDPTVTTLPSQTFGPKPLTDKILKTPYCVQYQADLTKLEAIGLLSNIGLIATYTYSPIPNDPLLGTSFLFAVGNFPLQVKTDAEEKVMRVEVQF